ncbi:MAG: flavodoxin family protein [Suilimivivens sp.]|nr:flavodoxin family protein [Lachnospiraceae bacterium]
MKVLLINGSPNEKGCTYTALSEVAATLNENGVETEIASIGKQPIRGCIGCGGCAGKRRCVFGDDIVNSMIEKMEQADGLIIGSPVYFASPNGNLMSMLDRFFYAGGCFAHKPAAAVASARRAGTTVTLDDMNKYFGIRQMPVVSSTYWNMVHGSKPEDVKKDEEGLQTMRNLGRNMAWLLKCIAAGKENGVEPPMSENTNRTNFIR